MEEGYFSAEKKKSLMLIQRYGGDADGDGKVYM